MESPALQDTISSKNTLTYQAKCKKFCFTKTLTTKAAPVFLRSIKILGMEVL